LVGVEASPEAKDNPGASALDHRRTIVLPRERASMFYVWLIVIAAIIFVALMFVRGRGRRA
jgi:hypothetical protein